MSMIMRTTVRNAREFAEWATRAAPGQPVTYHIGNLAIDRAAHPALHLLAETVLIFAECGFITTSQAIMRLPMATATWYSVARTGSGRAPRSILFGQCDAFAYRALQAVKSRDASKSATRAIRDQMGCQMDTAAAYLTVLTERKWVEPAEPKGIRLSAEGLRMLA
jgi:hypothetical protein